MNFIFYDLETTGLTGARIVEIAAYKRNNDTYFHEYVNPECLISPESTEIHKITNEQVKNKKTIQYVLKEFEEFCGENPILIAHNNDNFDKLVLKDEYNRVSLQIPDWKYIDSLKIARELLPKLESHKLAKLKEYYKTEIGQAHSAIDDVKNLVIIFNMLTKNLEDEEIYNMSENYVMKIMPFGKYKQKEIKKLPHAYKQWLIQNACCNNRNPDLLKALT